MSETTTLPGRSGGEGNNAQAKIFLVGVGQAQTSSSPTSGQPAETFILNSQDFLDLQKYVLACLALPSTASLFEMEYPAEKLSDYLKKEPKLYEDMARVLPQLHQRSSSFQNETLEPMTTLGGHISNFAKDASRRITRIITYLEKLGTMSNSSSDYSSTKQSASNNLKELTDHAAKMGLQCEDVKKQLTAFKTITQYTDKPSLAKICDRIRNIVPEAEAERSKVWEKLKNLDATLEMMRQSIELGLSRARLMGQPRWYHEIPAIGSAILVSERNELDKALKQIQEVSDVIQESKRNNSNALEQMVATSHQLKSLISEITAVENSIEGAIAAVDKMQTTFDKCQTEFAAIFKTLNYVKSDMKDEFSETYKDQVDDLKSAAQTWKVVETRAQVFQETGLVRSINSAPV